MDKENLPQDRASMEFVTFMDSLQPKEREELTEALREPNTFLAESMEDVLAILQTLQK